MPRLASLIRCLRTDEERLLATLAAIDFQLIVSEVSSIVGPTAVPSRTLSNGISDSNVIARALTRRSIRKQRRLAPANGDQRPRRPEHGARGPNCESSTR